MNQPNVILVLVTLFISGCATVAAQDANSQTAAPSDYLETKTHSVDGRLFIGPQPDSTDLQNLKAEGIRRVVSFRTPSEMAKLDFREEQELSDLGIDYVEIPVGGAQYPYSPVQLNALTETLQQDGNVLLHCGSGYRASVITVAYLIEEQGMPIDEAVRHAEGWWPLELEEVLGQQLSLTRKSTTR